MSRSDRVEVHIWSTTSHNLALTSTMPAATLGPQKRVLADSTNAHANPKATLPSPSATKRRKVDVGSSPAKRLKLSQNGVKTASSQPKSQFEEEVLEKLTQDISGLKEQNSERDQQWERPPLHDFDERKDALCFQQIEVEEGTLHGGRTALKLFGVTEVGSSSESHSSSDIMLPRLGTLYFYMSRISFIIFMWQLQYLLPSPTQKGARPTWKRSWPNINRLSTPFRW